MLVDRSDVGGNVEKYIQDYDKSEGAFNTTSFDSIKDSRCAKTTTVLGVWVICLPCRLLQRIRDYGAI